MQTDTQKVLIVDDDPIVRALLSIIVGDHASFSVSQAEDGPSALNQIEVETPDILLADVHMPGMSGLDLLEVVRARYPKIRLILMSGSRSTPGGPHGVDGFYMKDGRNWPELISVLESRIPIPRHQQALL